MIVIKLLDEKISIQSFKAFYQDWNCFDDCHFSDHISFVSHVSPLRQLENTFIFSLQGKNSKAAAPNLG